MKHMSVKADITEWQKMEYEKAFDVYCVYMAIKLHFQTPTFDYGLYGPMNSYKFETFYAKEGPRKQFARLARRFESSKVDVIENYIIANFVKNPKVWVNGLMTRQAESNYDEWRKLYENFSYNFVDSCENILFPVIKESGLKFMDYLKPKSSDIHTAFMGDIIRKRFPFWLLVAINKVTGFIKAYDNIYKDDIYWNSESYMIKKIDSLVVDEELDHTRTKLRELILVHGL